MRRCTWRRAGSIIVGMNRRSVLIASGTLAVIAFGGSCTRRARTRVPPPAIISHADWETQRPVGYSADASRRNLKAGGSLTFHDLTVTVLATSLDSSTA